MSAFLRNACYFIMSTLVMLQVSFADTCPSIKNIRAHQLHHWKLYDSDNDSLLSTDAKDRFMQEAQQFALAEWVGNQQNGTVHCYYLDKTGSHLDAYLAKKSVAPSDAHHYWYQVSGSMHCAAGMMRCEFNKKNSQFAKK